MNKKKLIIVVLAVGCILMTGFYAKEKWFVSDNADEIQKNVNNGMKDHLFGKALYLDAGMDEITSLADVEKSADMIVIAQKISQDDPTVIYGEGGSIDIAYTLSNFNVKKVVNGSKLKAGDTFTMLENEAYDEKKDMTYHIAGYNMISKGTDYLLFLRQSETDPYYIVAGVNYGKVNLENNETDFPLALRNVKTDYAAEVLSEYDHQQQIRKEAQQKYAEFIK